MIKTPTQNDQKPHSKNNLKNKTLEIISQVSSDEDDNNNEEEEDNDDDIITEIKDYDQLTSTK